ncbi:unnamed protein product [Rotaria sp. Silwood1]|nr:unnamed protein product [Rotaria sp. Silwood1]
MSMAKKDLTKDDEKHSCDLAAYFTHLQLQPIYKIMTLKSVLNQAFNVCEKNSIDEHPLKYDEYNLFDKCTASYVPIYLFSTTEFQNNHDGDENLDSTIEKHGFNGAFSRTFSSSSIITTMKQETTLLK